MIADGIAIGSKLHTHQLHTHPLGVEEPVHRGVELVLFKKGIQVVAQGGLELAAQHRIAIELFHLWQGSPVPGVIRLGALVDGNGGRGVLVSQTDGTQVEAGIQIVRNDAAELVSSSKVDRVVVIVAVGHVGFGMIDDRRKREETAPLIHIHGVGDGVMEGFEGALIQGGDPCMEIRPIIQGGI